MRDPGAIVVPGTVGVEGDWTLVVRNRVSFPVALAYFPDDGRLVFRLTSEQA
jgi:hypothetical protein